METTRTNLDEADNGPLTGDLALAFAYWDDLRDGRIGPTWREFKLVSLPMDLIPWCTVVDVITKPLDFRFRFWGTARVALQGKDLTGCSVRDLQPPQFADLVFTHDREVVEAKTALHTVSTFDSDEDASRGTYEFLRLPISDDGANVSAILSASSYNESALRHMHRVLGTRPNRFGP